MNYWILDWSNDGALLPWFPRSRIRAWRYHKGESLAKEFPRKATVRFADKFPHRCKLYDFADNLENMPFVSGKVRSVLEKLGTRDLEFLPISVKDHEGVTVAADYFILNPIGSQDIIDMKKSKLRMSDLFEGEIDRIDKLALQAKPVAKGAHLFRAANMTELILIDDVLRAAFEQAGVTGYRLFKAQGWDGMRIGAAKQVRKDP